MSRITRSSAICFLLVISQFVRPLASARPFSYPSAADNPSLYQGYHRLAEGEGGFYYLSGGLLHYIDTAHDVNILLSASGATASELQADHTLRKASDAFFSGAACVFYADHHVYVLCLENAATNEWSLFQLPEQGGLREKLCTFYSETGHAALLRDTIYTVCTEYDALNQGTRYIDGYNIKSGRKVERVPFPSIENAGFQEVSIQRVTPWQDRLYIDVITMTEDGIHAWMAVLDLSEKAAFLIDVENLIPQTSLVSQACAFYQDQLLFNLIPKDYSSDSEVVVQTTDLYGKLGAFYTNLPLGQNLISNGHQMILAPPEISFLYQCGLFSSADPHANASLTVSSYENGTTKPIAAIAASDIHIDGRFICLSSKGEIFFTHDDGLYLDKLNTDGLVNYISVNDVNDVN